MAMSAFPELFLTWEGREYRCRPTMDVVTHIEQRVPLQKLAFTVVRDPESVPISHVAWVIYCLLHGAGAPCSADQVWQAMRTQELSTQDVTATLQYVIQEIYGVGPENPPKKTQAAAGKKSTTRRRST